MAGAEQDLNRAIQLVNTTINAANLVPKTLDETLKMIDVISRNLDEANFQKKAANLIKQKLGEGQDLKCLVLNNKYNAESIKDKLIRQGVPFISTKMNGQDAILYTSGDYDKVNHIALENKESITKEVPMNELSLIQCNSQEVNPEKFQMLKAIIDENNIPYSIKDNNLIYPKKYEDKILMANEIVAIQRQFPEVLNFEDKCYNNCLFNVNKFEQLCDQDSDARNCGFFDKDGTGIAFEGNRIYLIDKDKGSFTYTIFNKEDFVKSEEYANILEKLANRHEMAHFDKFAIVDQIKKDGITEEIVKKIQAEHKSVSKGIFEISDEEEKRLKEISKMTEVYMIDEHPGGFKEMKLARCLYSSQAITSTYREPDIDGPNDNKIPEDIKNNVKIETQSIKTHMLTTEEIERYKSEDKVLGNIIEKETSIVNLAELNIVNEEVNISLSGDN